MENAGLDEKYHMTGRQMRAARALLGWSAEDLAKRSRVGVTTIRRTEVIDGPVKMMAANVDAIGRTFTLAGVEIVHGPDGAEGVILRMKKPEAWQPA